MPGDGSTFEYVQRVVIHKRNDARDLGDYEERQGAAHEGSGSFERTSCPSLPLRRDPPNIVSPGCNHDDLLPQSRTVFPAALSKMARIGGNLHSITSSARASTVAGMSRPSAWAVFRLMTRSYLVGACTGRSDGFSPLSMRST